MSWVAFFIKLFLLANATLQVLQTVFKAAPEKFKELRYPLLNHTNHSPEMIWAHWTAMAMINGLEFNANIFSADLARIEEKNPHFRSDHAIDLLAKLQVVPNDDLETLRRTDRVNPADGGFFFSKAQ